MDTDLAIPFPFPVFGDQGYAARGARFRFWYSDTTFEWFKARGYTLYKSMYQDSDGINAFFVPRLPLEDMVEGYYPYAHHDSCMGNGPQGSKKCASSGEGKVGFAQDAAGRHVAIKLVAEGTDELRIYQLLAQRSFKTLKENCVLPVLEILSIKGFAFIVMPRWGSYPLDPEPCSLREVIHIIHSMLKFIENFLVSQFSSYYGSCKSPERTKLRSSGLITYAIFDFDISVMIPSDIDRSKLRFPYQMSGWGSWPQIPDTEQGEPDYDPFAFDVGTLGQLLCQSYQHLSRDLPLLGPLFDGMTTRNIPQRFTAKQALAFLEDRLSEHTDADLSKPYRALPANERAPYGQYNRWSHVPPDFARKWAMYKEPRLPLKTRLLRWLYSFVEISPLGPS